MFIVPVSECYDGGLLAAEYGSIGKLWGKDSLTGADFRGAGLKGVDFRDAQWAEAIFSGVQIDEDTQMDETLRDHILSQNPELKDKLSEASDE